MMCFADYAIIFRSLRFPVSIRSRRALVEHMRGFVTDDPDAMESAGNVLWTEYVEWTVKDRLEPRQCFRTWCKGLGYDAGLTRQEQHAAADVVADDEFPITHKIDAIIDYLIASKADDSAVDGIEALWLLYRRG